MTIVPAHPYSSATELILKTVALGFPATGGHAPYLTNLTPSAAVTLVNPESNTGSVALTHSPPLSRYNKASTSPHPLIHTPVDNLPPNTPSHYIASLNMPTRRHVESSRKFTRILQCGNLVPGCLPRNPIPQFPTRNEVVGWRTPPRFHAISRNFSAMPHCG
ncbi:unnamed protein product, partial [Iphiclides podalirius]